VNKEDFKIENGYIKPLPSVIEPIIALSIFFVAIENILVQKLKPGRIGIVFLFGLVHGMGFAGALTELGLPPSSYFVSLLSFNVGVELGVVAVILGAYLLAGRWFSDKPWYRSRVVTPSTEAVWVEHARGKCLREIEDEVAQREPGDLPRVPRGARRARCRRGDGDRDAGAA